LARQFAIPGKRRSQTIRPDFGAPVCSVRRHGVVREDLLKTPLSAPMMKLRSYLRDYPGVIRRRRDTAPTAYRVRRMVTEPVRRNNYRAGTTSPCGGQRPQKCVASCARMDTSLRADPRRGPARARRCVAIQRDDDVAARSDRLGFYEPVRSPGVSALDG